ncbi:MAG: hypothetical protein ABIO24_06480 [Saprospiraceae bacterium]
MDELLSIVDRLAIRMEEAGGPYQLVGGMAMFLRVREISEENARLTNDVDVSIRRADLNTIRPLAAKHGFGYRNAAGIDRLIDAEKRKAKGAVHFVFAGEMVRAHELAPVPDISIPERFQQVYVASISHLLIVNLTSNRFKDMAHIRDMRNVGLITPEIEAAVPEQLRDRLAFIKSHE